MTVPIGFSPLAPAWADNMSLDTLNAAVALNSRTGAGTHQATNQQRFWSTPTRPATSPIKEVMEVSLSSARLVNHVRFDVAIFPQDVTVEFFDVTAQVWTAALNRACDQPDPVVHSVRESVPPVLPPTNTVSGHLHPQHSFSGHWHPVEFHLRPIRCNRLRVVLRRSNLGVGPVNVFGQLVDFSLAVRRLYVGYRVDSLEQVPTTNPSSYTEAQPFSSTTDLLGSAVQFTLRTNKAENILPNLPNTTGQLVWRCEPQPWPWAVVNFYVDARDSNGGGQVIDRFFLDPLTDGPNVNLYYSNDTPAATFTAGHDPLSTQVVTATGQVQTTTSGLDFGPVGKAGYVEVNNTAISFDPGAAWWLGLALNFKFNYGDAGVHPVFDCGVFALVMTPGGLRFTTPAGDSWTMRMGSFRPADRVVLLASYDGAAIHLRATAQGQAYALDRRLSVRLPAGLVHSLRLGGLQQAPMDAGPPPAPLARRLTGTQWWGFWQDDDLVDLLKVQVTRAAAVPSADATWSTFVLKAGEVPSAAVLQDFFTNPQPYALKPQFAHDDDHKTNNALLRFDPSYVSPNFPSGFVGGPPDFYANMVWSPIARDYILRRGYLSFPPTKAKYWKLEFCNLTPQPFEVYVPIRRTVKTYKTEQWQGQPQESESLLDFLSHLFPGVLASINLSAIFSFADSLIRGAGTNINALVTGFTNTMARIIADPHVQKLLSDVSWVWRFLSWHPPTWTPSFTTTTVHTYEEHDVEQTTKMAFFVGLKAIQAYRLDYLSVEDTGQYVEMFHDTANLSADSGWTLTADHQLSSGGSRFAQVQSQVLSSARLVRAVQFATQQSAPRQLLPDDDFDDPAHAHWHAIGDARLAPFTTVVPTVGSTLQVSRSSRQMAWAPTAQMLTGLESTYPTWAAITNLGLTWGQLETSGNPPQYSGGVESDAVATPPGGRLYAAARVVAPADLSSPLWVQLVDADTGYVVSEASADVKANQVTEWHAGYTIGSGRASLLAWRWSDFAAVTAYPAWTDGFRRANATNLGNLDTGQTWSAPNSGGTPAPLQIQTNEAVQVAGGAARSYIDPPSPWGSLDVVIGAMGSAAAAPLLEFDPFTLNDAGVLSFTGSSNASLPAGSVFGGHVLVAGDDIRIDILPTKLVPLGRRDVTQPRDDVSAPYSLVFSINGTWTQTVGHRLGTRVRRGIQGRAGQHFRSFTWTPASYGALSGPVVWQLPVAANGSLDSSGLTFTDNESQVWTLLGQWDTTGTSLVVSANRSRIVTDTQYYFGSLHAQVHNVATGINSLPPHGNILVLDEDNAIYLDVNGNIVRQTYAYNSRNEITSTTSTTQGNIIPGGVRTGTMVSVQFADTKQVATGIRGGIDPALYPKMLIARVNGVVVGTFASVALQGWLGTRRGLAGDRYDTGTDANGNPNPMPGSPPAAALSTSFDAVDWSPDTFSVIPSPAAPTWDDVTQHGTATFDQASRFYTLTPRHFKARMVQRTPGLDVWSMDTLSMFADPIVWSFSNDGGANFYNAFDIKNNPDGVLLFPDQPANAPTNAGKQLVWRVVSYDANATVSSLVIRPWYAGLLSGITHRVGLSAGGPNVMPFDHYPSLRQDARFQTWNKPIPQDWFYRFRLLARSKDAPLPTPRVIVLSRDLVSDTGGH